jgi:Tol biopolymer transport system component
MRYSLLLPALAVLVVQCKSEDKKDGKKNEPEYYEAPQHHKDTLQVLHYPEEKHFKNVRQLTFGGNNAEAYFSFDNNALTFQSDYEKWDVKCDQIFFFDLNKDAKRGDPAPQMMSTGQGRTTCSYFMPGNQEILYASTHLGGKDCPEKPAPRSDHKYLWPVYDSYDIFVADLKGDIKKQLTNSKGYDAEATVSPKGDLIVFTSTRSGDLELWTMNIDGSNQKQVTSGLGYDGGAFFSPDGKKLVFRASRPKTPEEVKEYKDFLKQGLVAPSKMEIYTCNIDGSDLKQITHLGNANWAPFFNPAANKIIFSSNHAGGGFHFNLYMINLDGTGLEQVSHDKTFDAFPMFSFDGKKLVFSSNRNNGGSHDTNLFLAEWVD